jgi:hypothetical protein
VETLVERLEREGNPYALLFEQLIDILGLSETPADSHMEALH